MSIDVQIHFNRLGLSGGTLVVVAVGSEVYAAAAAEPMRALYAAAHDAARDLAEHGRTIDVAFLVEQGEKELRAIEQREGVRHQDQEVRPPASPASAEP